MYKNKQEKKTTILKIFSMQEEKDKMYKKISLNDGILKYEKSING